MEAGNARFFALSEMTSFSDHLALKKLRVIASIRRLL